MKTYVVTANGYNLGVYSDDSKQAARDACARDAGDKNEADLVAQLERTSNLIATELETTMARLLGDVLEMLEDPDANEFDADRIARQIRDVLKAGGVV